MTLSKCSGWSEAAWTWETTLGRKQEAGLIGIRGDAPPIQSRAGGRNWNWNAFKHKSEGREGTKTGCGIFGLLLLCPHVSPSVPVGAGKQAASWCRCLESSAEMRYERWLWIQHEGPQREWSRMSVYSPKHLDRLLVFHTLSTWSAPVPLWLSEIHLSPSALLSLSQPKKQTKNLKAAVSEKCFSLK